MILATLYGRNCRTKIQEKLFNFFYTDDSLSLDGKKLSRHDASLSDSELCESDEVLTVRNMAGAVIQRIEQVLEKLLCSFVIIVPPFQSDVIHSVVLFMTCNTDFKILPLNVRGIRFFEKRKATFNSIANGKEIRYYLFARDLRYSRS